MGNSNKKLLVGSNDTYALSTGGGAISGMNQLDLLETGAIALFMEDGTLIDGSTTTNDLANVNNIYIVAGNQNITPKHEMSIEMDRDAFWQIKCEPAATQKKVITVGYNGTAGTTLGLPSTFGNGEEVTLTINQDASTDGFGTYKPDSWTIQVITNNADTIATVATKLRDKIIAQTDGIMTASVTGTGATTAIVITTTSNAVDPYNFNVAVSELLEFSTITTTTPMKDAKGTYAQMLKEEQESWIGDGDYGKLHVERENMWKVTSVLNPAATYVTYTFQWTTEHSTALGVRAVANPIITLAIDAAATTLIGVLDNIFAVVFNTPTTSSGASPAANV